MSEFVICYDISDPARRGGVFRYLKNCAVALQYSVFLYVGDQRQLDQCIQTVAGMISTEADDLRAYPLPANGLKARLGKPVLPEGIHWGSLPSAW